MLNVKLSTKKILLTSKNLFNFLNLPENTTLYLKEPPSGTHSSQLHKNMPAAKTPSCFVSPRIDTTFFTRERQTHEDAFNQTQEKQTPI